MLRHIGSKRNFRHNVRLAVLLCLNAGFINAAGFMVFMVLTTNVTGHAALLAVNLAEGKLRAARMVALWLFLFLSGAFSSSLFISKHGRDKASAYTIPILFIILVLLFVATAGGSYDHSLKQTEYFAGSLLFSMGVQNAMVSIVSGSVVRTTHLTGMFTDLGVDLSAAVLSLRNINKVLKRRILLRLTIIVFFLLGGIAGGLVFQRWSFIAFYIPVGILIVTLFYDYFRVRITRAITKSIRSSDT
ncbi:MAG: YoaK family protein [Flavipsychrobacter sp.]